MNTILHPLVEYAKLPEKCVMFVTLVTQLPPMARLSNIFQQCPKSYYIMLSKTVEPKSWIFFFLNYLNLDLEMMDDSPSRLS